MDTELNELKELSEQTDAKIQRMVIQKMKNVQGGIQISGNKNTAIQAGQFTRSSKDQIQRYLAELKEGVERHREQLPKAEDMLSDIDRVARDLAEDQPDTVSILSRINDVVKLLIRFAPSFPGLIHLGNQLLHTATSVFQK